MDEPLDFRMVRRKRLCDTMGCRLPKEDNLYGKKVRIPGTPIGSAALAM